VRKGVGLGRLFGLVLGMGFEKQTWMRNCENRGRGHEVVGCTGHAVLMGVVKSDPELVLRVLRV